MGTVAFDPDEMTSLAGQLTSTAGSVFPVQGQVAMAAEDPGLLPFGEWIAVQAIAAVGGLTGVQANLIQTAGEITTTVANYDTAMAAAGAVPVLTQIVTHPFAAYWAINELNGLYGDIGGFTVDGMNALATKARESHSPLWPWMQAAHQFLGNQWIRLILNSYATASSWFALGCGWAALGIEVFGGGPEDLPADAFSLIFSVASACFSAQNLEANALLAAGGDQKPQVKQSIGSDEVSLATFGISRYVKAISGAQMAPKAAQALEGISVGLKAISWTKLALGTGTFIAKHLPEPETMIAVNTTEALARAGVQEAPKVPGAVAHTIEQANLATVRTVENAGSTVKSDVERLAEWLRKHPGAIPHTHNPAPGTHGSH